MCLFSQDSVSLEDVENTLQADPHSLIPQRHICVKSLARREVFFSPISAFSALENVYMSEYRMSFYAKLLIFHIQYDVLFMQPC